MLRGSAPSLQFVLAFAASVQSLLVFVVFSQMSVCGPTVARLTVLVT